MKGYQPVNGPWNSYDTAFLIGLGLAPVVGVELTGAGLLGLGDSVLATDTITTTTINTGSSFASITVQNGVGTVTVDFASGSLTPLVNAIQAEAERLGVTTLVVQTGPVTVPSLAAALADRASSGATWLGGVIQQIESTGGYPQFTITFTK